MAGEETWVKVPGKDFEIAVLITKTEGKSF